MEMVDMGEMARLGVLFDKNAADMKWQYGVNVFERYIQEILLHEGIPFIWAEDAKELIRTECDLWLIALEPDNPLEEWLLPFVKCDQTRGPSKQGNTGFLFGTCQPYFPISWFNEHNRFYDVLEVGFLSQDLDIGTWADRSVVKPFLEQVYAFEGVAHILFH